VDLIVLRRPARPRPAGWLTGVRLAWAAAVMATALTFATAALAAFGLGMSVLVIPSALAWAWMGCVLLARRPDHPMSPLLCLIGLAAAISDLVFAYQGYALAHAPGVETFGPAGLPDPYVAVSAEPVLVAVLVLALACVLSAVAATVVAMLPRHRRPGRAGRQQLLWFFAVLPVTAACCIAGVFSGGPAPAPPVSLLLGSLFGVLVPVGIGVAVLRYRLSGIDVLLNRAVLYGSLAAVVTAVYLAVVTVARAVIGVDPGPAVQVPAAAVAIMAFWLLRGLLRRWVDQLFYGDRGVPYDVLARLGRRVEEAAGPESALDSVVRTVADSLRLPYAAVELRLGDEWRPAAVYGDAPAEVVTFPLIAQRETVGRLLVGRRAPGEQLGADDERLLADLARQAGPATHAVALRRALDASRAELVTMQEEERRRLRRDLHDGLGPTLAGLTLGLDTARTLAPELPDLQDLLGSLKAETQRAVTDVRRIVYGLRPPALDELGLAGSLAEEIRRLQCRSPAVQVTLDAPGSGLADLPAAVEVACYRIVTEALTNVARHAHATGCRVRIRLDHGLEVEVRDDGVGLPDGWRTGVGIASMRERVAELGGNLEIGPALPRGTRIAARLPAGEQL
jgi:signal transduction histidine kinase